ncbi:MAG: restriction endonuclease [Bacillota bacterium]
MYFSVDSMRESLGQELFHLTESQLLILEDIINQLKRDKEFRCNSLSDIVSEDFLNVFGDGLLIHHCFSKEAFSKDKFEHLMERAALLSGYRASLAPKGNPGHDITINGDKVSLKTEAARNIKGDKIHISKFMELGKGNWGDNEIDLYGLRNQFFTHLTSYDRIFTLRVLSKAPHWHYELVEIPKALLELSQHGEMEMMNASKQYPKPGYCRVWDGNNDGVKLFELYFDGGGERKLQIKHLLKEHCIVHADWKFDTE